MAGGMPRRVGHPCAAPGCPAVVRSGLYCDAHRQADKQPRRQADRPRPSPSRRGYDRIWQKLRLIHLAEHPLCVHCQRDGRITVATQVHHIQPLSAGGTNARENLQSLCDSCHSRVTRACHSRKTMSERG